jgi:hypothetical protein
MTRPRSFSVDEFMDITAPGKPPSPNYSMCAALTSTQLMVKNLIDAVARLLNCVTRGKSAHEFLITSEEILSARSGVSLSDVAKCLWCGFLTLCRAEALNGSSHQVDTINNAKSFCLRTKNCSFEGFSDFSMIHQASGSLNARQPHSKIIQLLMKWMGNFDA